MKAIALVDHLTESDQKVTRMHRKPSKSVPDGQEIAMLSGHTGRVNSISFSPDGLHFAYYLGK